MTRLNFSFTQFFFITAILYLHGNTECTKRMTNKKNLTTKKKTSFKLIPKHLTHIQKKKQK